IDTAEAPLYPTAAGAAQPHDEVAVLLRVPLQTCQAETLPAVDRTTQPLLGCIRLTLRRRLCRGHGRQCREMIALHGPPLFGAFVQTDRQVLATAVDLCIDLQLQGVACEGEHRQLQLAHLARGETPLQVDRKSTRLNSSHVKISYA